ncbi:c2h2 finger domain containing protein [Grosmannia clavigera kw1407]|uniref:C2h2 finger domain containing protein n=1 Tax=Grosmannia clavigera (strain kw1407 / UAMH 11150) TaxID=655863 RepID=F0XC03_GROCL|nr:c2h2 finger domain containing protein [Grosmannia clavigera kw1407]EFX03524.1 c2h2 finger domain containing protein [Grosmannia clavigera kw1407]
MASFLPSLNDASPYTASGYQQHEAAALFSSNRRTVHFQDMSDMQDYQNIDPSLCATFPNLSQHMTWMSASPLSPPSIFFCESDAYESDASPSTPEDLNGAASVAVFPQSRQGTAATACSRLSPQPLSLLQTGDHLEYMDTTRYVSPKDVSSANAMLASVIEADGGYRHPYYSDMYSDMYGFGTNSNVPQYNPQDAGHTLDDEVQSLASHLHQPYMSYSATECSIPRTLSPEPMESVYFKEEDVEDRRDSSTIYAHGAVATSERQDSAKRRRSSAAASTIAVASGSRRRRNHDETAYPSSSSLSPKPLAPSAIVVASNEPAPSCNVFSTSTSLQAKLKDHRKKESERPFVCLFAYAGCTSAFGNKNEWKRHVMAQHIMLTYWRCDDPRCERMRNNMGSCARNEGSSSSGTAYHASEQNNSGIFNRKDLFTQHVRRMHMSDTLKAVEKKYKKDQQQWEQAQAAAGKALKGGGSSSGSAKSKRKRAAAGSEAETGDETATTAPLPSPIQEPAALQRWNEDLVGLQARSGVVRCSLPTDLTCPACDDTFHGDKAWAERLEHVAGHMQTAHEAGRRPWTFGGLSDPTLTRWAEKDDVRIVQRSGTDSWTLNKPLQRVAGGGSTTTQVESEDDDDSL